MANEKRLIWDEDAKRHLIALAVGHHTETLHIDMILNAILHHTPTVDAVPVVHGRWIIKSKEIRPFEYVAIAECSECHKKTESDRSIYISGFSMDMVDEIVRREAKTMGLGNYCPNCGAKMDGDGNV